MGRNFQKLGAKTVEGGDGQPLRDQEILMDQIFLFQMLKGLVRQLQQPAFMGRAIRVRFFPTPEIPHGPLPKFARGLAGKSQGQKFPGRIVDPGQQGEKAGQEDGGLAGTGRGLQVEASPGVQGPFPGFLVAGGGHQVSSSASTASRS